MTELPPIEDKIQQIFKFLEIADVSKWQGMNVFEAGDADSLYGVLKTAFEQVESETEKRVIERVKIEQEMFDNYRGKSWSTAIQKCFEAPFPLVAMQYLLQRVYQKAKDECHLPNPQPIKNNND